MITLSRYHAALDSCEPTQASGVVLRVVGLTVAASGPSMPLGDTCAIRGSDSHERIAVVVGFREGEVLLQPIGHLDGIRPGDQVVALRRPLDIPVGPALIGRIIDGVGNPIDGRGPIPGSARRTIHAEPPPALGRQPINRILETGLKAVDTMFTIGCGQRMGIFSGSGVGKSTLLGEMA